MEIHEKVRYFQARQKLEKLNEERNQLLVEYAGYNSSELFAVFEEPFKDVFKALKLTAMDTSNSLQLMTATLWNVFDMKGLNEAFSEYDKKRQNIKQKWGPLLETSIEAIESMDPFLTMFISPQTILGAQSILVASDLIRGSTEIVAGKSWDAITSKLHEWWGWEPEKGRGGTSSGGGAGAAGPAATVAAQELKKIREMLHDLFYKKPKEKSVKTEGLLREAKGSKGDPEKNKGEFFKDVLRLTGLDAEFANASGEFLQSQSEMYKEAQPQAEAAIILEKITRTQSFDEFEKAVEEAVKEKKIPEANIAKFKNIVQSMRQQADKMSKDKNFIDNLKKKMGATSDQEISEALIKENALSFVFNESSKKFFEKSKAQLKEIFSTLKKIEDQSKLKASTIQDVRENQKDIFSAPKFLEVYDKFQKSYDELNSLVSKSS